MPAATEPDRPRLSIADFRRFIATRPDEEHWELIDGVAMMMAPATKAHQRIAGNLERLLNDALERSNPALVAIQRGGLDLTPVTKDYDPEPDVVVIDADEADDARYFKRFYLAAEIVSASDRKKVQLKRKIYKLKESCTCVLTIRQDRREIRVDLRGEEGWREALLQRLEDPLMLPEFGFRCTLAHLYRGTSLIPRRSR